MSDVTDMPIIFCCDSGNLKGSLGPQFPFPMNRQNTQSNPRRASTGLWIMLKSSGEWRHVLWSARFQLLALTTAMYRRPKFFRECIWACIE
jgi:hypothetical protein